VKKLETVVQDKAKYKRYSLDIAHGSGISVA
jgi:hypothetical protein